MPVQECGLVCGQCKTQRLHTRKRFSDGLALALTLFSCGLFLPVWVLIAFCETFTPWRCQACGSVWRRPRREPADWEARGRAVRSAAVLLAQAPGRAARGAAAGYRSLPEWAAPIAWGLGAAGVAVGAFLVLARLR